VGNIVAARIEVAENRCHSVSCGITASRNFTQPAILEAGGQGQRQILRPAAAAGMIPLVTDVDCSVTPSMNPNVMSQTGAGYRLTVAGRVVCAAAALTCAAVLAIAASVTPDPRGYGTHERLGLRPCGFQLMFNIPCPSCGSTTSFAHFVRGEFGMAARTNPAAMLLAAAMTLSVPWLLAGSVLGRLWKVDDPLRWTAIAACSLVLVALVHWLARITPFTRRFLG
jgi:hypothetical protein